MKKMKLVFSAAIFLLSVSGQTLYAQTEGLSKEQWLEQMNNEEQKIANFVTEQMGQVTINDALKRSFLSSDQHHEVNESELLQLAERYVQEYYRNQYFVQHPEAVKVYNPGRVTAGQVVAGKPESPAGAMTNIACQNGNFESATTATLGSLGYTGYKSPASYNLSSSGLCTFVPATNVAYTNVGFSMSENFLLTNNVSDPFIPSLKQTNNNSNHAIRINSYDPCKPLGGVNMLQRSFTASSTGKARINFSYALVMEDPSHGNHNPFFVARVLNNAGSEIGTRICKVSSSSDPTLNTATIAICDRRQSPAVWRNWDCDYIEFKAQANKKYTIEFFVADCAPGGHFAYAYVDDICADITCCKTVVQAPANVKCTPVDDGSKLSWDPVPGAAYYTVSATQYDPACCQSSPTPFPNFK